MYEIMLGRPRCRNWIPLVTQQLRLRHLVQIIGYNIKVPNGSLYYTLHATTMCAPFYTSEKIESCNPKWAELDVNVLQNSPAAGFVLRVWCHEKPDVPDKIILTWGIYLSGLVYLGTKLSDIQPPSFKSNTVIFQLNGGYYTSENCITQTSPKPLLFIDSLNVLSDENKTSIIRYSSVKCAKSEVRISYNVKKLQRLHSLQQSIKNKSLDAAAVREKIHVKMGMDETPTNVSPLRESPEPSTSSGDTNFMALPSLSRIMNKKEQPSKFERKEISKLRKLVENAKFRTKMLSQERDRKLANIRHLNTKCTNLIDSNEDKNSELMSLYRHLSREIEKLRDWRRNQIDMHELYLHSSAQLHLRRKQLMKQLLLIYPIEKISEDKYKIMGVHLPDSEALQSVPENSLSVALGYVTHTVVMCSTFLQVPLRYPLTHLGARSKIFDHINPNIPDREREFPLYTKGTDRLQFQYAIYLLNKNIAQLRWYCGLPTFDLRATLPNLYTLLNGISDLRYENTDSNFGIIKYLSSISNDYRSGDKTISKKYGSFSQLESSNFGRSIDRLDSANISSSLEQIFSPKVEFSPIRKVSRSQMSDSGPSLSQILIAPSNFKARNDFLKFKNIVEASNCDKNLKKTENVTPNCVDCNIEQGLDILDPSHNLICTSQNEHSKTENFSEIPISNPKLIKMKRRISRSVGSITDDENLLQDSENLEVGSDPLSKCHNFSNLNLTDGRKEFLQSWFNNAELVCSEENLLSSTTENVNESEVISNNENRENENDLTIRTEALVQELSSFHLVKPKHN